MRRLKVRTALDTTIEVYANFELTHLKNGEINWKATAQELHELIRDNSSEQFWRAFQSLSNSNSSDSSKETEVKKNE